MNSTENEIKLKLADIKGGEEDTLNTLVSDLFRNTDGKKASLNDMKSMSLNLI
jgi:hypothetical protein